jgi:hypothetical protein
MQLRFYSDDTRAARFWQQLYRDLHRLDTHWSLLADAVDWSTCDHSSQSPVRFAALCFYRCCYRLCCHRPYTFYVIYFSHFVLLSTLTSEFTSLLLLL